MRRRLSERGAAAVEMAIVLPVLVLLIGGIIDFSRAMYYQVVLSNAAREGARVAIVTGSPYTEAQAQQIIKVRARCGSDPIGRPTLCTDAAFPVIVEGPTVGSAIPTCVNATTSTPAISITARAPFQWFLMDAFIPSLASKNTLKGQAVVKCL